MVKKLEDSEVGENQKGSIQDGKGGLTREEKDKLWKAKKKKQKKEKKKQKNGGEDEEPEILKTMRQEAKARESQQGEDEEVEWVKEDEYLLAGQYYEEFKKVFQYFSTPSDLPPKRRHDDDDDMDEEKKKAQDAETQAKAQERANQMEKISKKRRKQLKLQKVAQLKAMVKRPDVVEVWDVSAPDPIMLVYLKSYKNTVPVPRHWSQKRKFLQNKRGVLKQAFKLPEFIENTGIAKLRDPFNDKDAGRLVRQKLRERMNPKLGKIDIDYEILHDAFFKHQNKPKMTSFGDIYFEGKEDEVKMKSFKPGRVSELLREALGISEFATPPWIINMQRYGPPPSYPNLKIPGLNAPLPEGANYGLYFARPVDDKGKPILQGNIYGTFSGDVDADIAKKYWGEITEEGYEEEEIIPPQDIGMMDERSEMDTKAGISSVTSGFETPDVDLRKGAPQTTPRAPNIQNTNHNPSDRPLYQILEPANTQAASSSLFGSGQGYVIPGVNDKAPRPEPPAKTMEEEKKKTSTRDQPPNFKF